jgi:5-methylcytosine-specific restriction enzyme subunit McrC
LEEKDKVSVQIDDNTELLNLFAKILIHKVKILLKKGIDRNYIDVTEELAAVKGKLEFSQTVKKSLHLQQRAICSYDDFSPNIITNQILLSTFHRLLKTVNLDLTLKQEIKKLLWMFGDVQTIELNASSFKDIHIHRNNRLYGMILDICQLIFDNTLPSEQQGTWLFKDFTRDERKMAKVFEDFVRNFYRFEQSEYTVRRENIDWQMTSASQKDLDFLPTMETDITLENNESKIIIDTKYYSETLSVYYDHEHVHSTNLYQLFSYLLNQQTGDINTLRTEGILLYPTIDNEYDLRYQYGEHDIYIHTINLNMQWKDIHNRLLAIIS